MALNTNVHMTAAYYSPFSRINIPGDRSCISLSPFHSLKQPADDSQPADWMQTCDRPTLTKMTGIAS